jgi:ribonuclease HII
MLSRRDPLLKMENEEKLRERGYQVVLGTDESGNGCVAGPIVVATCGLLRKDMLPIDGVNDSKLLTQQEIHRIYDIVTSQKDLYAWNVVLVNPSEIDNSDIPTMTKAAMKNSIEKLIQEFNLSLDTTYSIVDGHKTPKLSMPLKCRPWVKGDAQVYTVALASIIAKHQHNTIVQKMHDQYPQYGFDRNHGYPTREHIVAIHTFGPSPLHRMSSRPLKGR